MENSKITIIKYAIYSVLLPVLILLIIFFYGYGHIVTSRHSLLLLSLNISFNILLLKDIYFINCSKRESLDNNNLLLLKKIIYAFIVILMLWFSSFFVKNIDNLNFLIEINNNILKSKLHLKQIEGIAEPSDYYRFDYHENGYVTDKVVMSNDTSKNIKARTINYYIESVDIQNEKHRLFFRCSINGLYHCKEMFNYELKTDIYGKEVFAEYISNYRIGNLLYSIKVEGGNKRILIDSYIKKVYFEIVIHLLFLFCLIFAFLHLRRIYIS